MGDTTVSLHILGVGGGCIVDYSKINVPSSDQIFIGGGGGGEEILASQELLLLAK